MGLAIYVGYGYKQKRLEEKIKLQRQPRAQQKVKVTGQ